MNQTATKAQEAIAGYVVDQVTSMSDAALHDLFFRLNEQVRRGEATPVETFLLDVVYMEGYRRMTRR